LWSLWYFGRPQSVAASTWQVRPDQFPKVEDHGSFTLRYPQTVGVFEASWNLPRSFQDLELFGPKGSLYMTRQGVEFRPNQGPAEQIPVPPLPAEQAEPIRYMVEAIKANKPIEGVTAIGINVQVMEIMDAALKSAKAQGQPQRLR
jgi:scyllo-inositol 2-dehydrogenase (NADP+)